LLCRTKPIFFGVSQQREFKNTIKYESFFQNVFKSFGKKSMSKTFYKNMDKKTQSHFFPLDFVYLYYAFGRFFAWEFKNTIQAFLAKKMQAFLG
jgi:hypothetical protein